MGAGALVVSSALTAKVTESDERAVIVATSRLSHAAVRGIATLMATVADAHEERVSVDVLSSVGQDAP